MSLQAADKLGPYEIEAPIGSGGMGEVYRALDRRLNRRVAIKVSAAAFSERFAHEARSIAALNHPNVCTLHDVGENYLVMELVEGPTLAERIAGRPVAFEDALRIARQIAAALEAAHEKGIVHRDLKPGNIKITPDGTVKVLDFGLAKTSEAAAGDPQGSPTTSPTMTISPTRAGMILGTASYMSPEQARGKVVDKRSDIWAFGVVLCEMLTGKRPFHGEDIAEILASVVKEKPDLSGVPAKVRPLLERCLEKDPRKRLRDIGDAMPLIDDVPEKAEPRSILPWVIATGALVIVAMVLGAIAYRATRPVSRPLVRVSVDLGPDAIPAPGSGGGAIISPDGTRLAFLAQGPSPEPRLLTRLLEQTQATPLSGTEGARNPFFSPDAQWIAFFAGGKLKKIAVQGGAPVTLCDAPNPRGGSWGEDGNIVFAANSREGLSRVSEAGGKPSAATQLDTKNGEITQRWPQVLPGAKAVLFATGTTLDREDLSVAAQSLKTGEKKILQRGGFNGRYLATSDGSGHLVYLHGDTLFAAPMKLERLELTGAGVPVVEEVSSVGGGGASLDFSQTGTFIFVAGRAASGDRNLAWMDSAGKLQALPAPPKRYRHPRLSPDGKRLAVSIATTGGDSDLWVYDFERDTFTQLTFLKQGSQNPVWTPDGSHIAFGSGAEGTHSIYWVRAGGGEPQRLTEGKPGRQDPTSFSPDGKRLTFVEGGTDIWTLPLEDSGTDHPKPGKPELFLRGRFLQRMPYFSPDGRWIAYGSSESAGPLDVYVRPYTGASPAPGDKWLVSTTGGDTPCWARNGHELFYITLDRRLMAVNYTVKGGAFIADKPRVWSERQLAIRDNSTWLFDPAPDGKRVLVLTNPPETEVQKPPTHVTFLFNFFDYLRQRVPVGK